MAIFRLRIQPRPAAKPIYQLVEWIYVSGCVFSAWVLLSIVGRERQRRLEEMQLLAKVDAFKKAQQDESNARTSATSR
jgi:hypothetical protein